jgi:hypothetical protein
MRRIIRWQQQIKSTHTISECVLKLFIASLARDPGLSMETRGESKERCHVKLCHVYAWQPIIRTAAELLRSLALSHTWLREQSAPRCTCEMRVLCLWKEACREIRERRIHKISIQRTQHSCEFISLRQLIIAGAPPTLAMCHAALINLSCMPIVCRSHYINATAAAALCISQQSSLCALETG